MGWKLYQGFGLDDDDLEWIEKTLKKGRRVLLERHRVIRLPIGKYHKAVEVGLRRHEHGASDTRGAGVNKMFHIKGAVAEAAILHELGVDRPPHLFSHASVIADIPESRPEIEVKSGVPLVWRRHVRPDACYVVLVEVGRGHDGGAWFFRVTRLALGQQIISVSQRPPDWMCPRGSSALENWEIPADLMKYLDVRVP